MFEDEVTRVGDTLAALTAALNPGTLPGDTSTAVLILVITRGVDLAHITHLGRGPTAAQRIALAWTSPQCSVLGCPRAHVQTDSAHRPDLGPIHARRQDAGSTPTTPCPATTATKAHPPLIEEPDS